MSKRTYAIVLIVAAVLVMAAIALRGEGGGLLTRWLSTLHGR